MMRTYSVLSVLTLTMLGLALAGCSKEARVATVPASGVVTFQGKPLAGAEVVFMCDAAPRAAQGTTDAAGKFQLTTYADADGAVAGTHKVTVTKAKATAEVSGASADDPTAAYGNAMEAAASGDMAAIQNSELPDKYANPDTSGLTFSVSEGGPNEFEIKLD